MQNIAIAIHGGAGTIARGSITPEIETQYRYALDTSLRAGHEILLKGGSAMDAVEAAVRLLEDDPLFNAGRGSVFDHQGRNEMDAAIMDGRSLRAGAVAAVRGVKNPISLARLVIERTEHILLAGGGAIEFAEECGVELADDAYFYTDRRWAELEEAKKQGRVVLDHSDLKPIGTVGAVARDSSGALAAATSTGGMTNKKFGRIGDTPLIGSGTFANDICAVSCTGHGEFFVLGVTAYDVAARMKYKGLGISDAVSETVGHLSAIGGEGGLVAVDSDGNTAMPFNSEGMYRGSADRNGIKIEIYR